MKEPVLKIIYLLYFTYCLQANEDWDSDHKGLVLNSENFYNYVG